MDDEKFDVEDAIWQLRILLVDETQGLLQATLKKDFNKEYEQFDLLTAWECFVSEINRIDKVCDLHDFLAYHIEDIKKLGETENE